LPFTSITGEVTEIEPGFISIFELPTCSTMKHDWRPCSR
jgi:hypothetical protein